jgi:TP901 family phage tail tape measure protein
VADRVLAYELLATDRFSGVFDKAGKSAAGFTKQVDKASEAELRSRSASVAAERAAIAVTAARKRAEATAKSATATEFARQRAVLAVEQAEIGHAQALGRADAANRQLAESNKRVGFTSQLAERGARGFGVAAAAGAAGLFVMVKTAAAFDAAMSNVQALTSASAGELDQLRTAALQAGRDTAFGATQAAEGEAELAKAGVETADIVGGALVGALNLASAGQISVADAATIAATAMTQFGLSGAQVPHIADLLAAAADKAQGGVADLGEALKFVGPVANQMGVSVEQTVGTLGFLASQGLLASQAGEGLRGVLSSLTSPSKLASETMAKLGINVYDASGNFVGFSGVAGQLHKALSGLTDTQRDSALGMIFGNAQVTVARVLYAGGAAAVKDWTGKVNDSGFAAQQANAKLNNLSGDVKKLGGSIQTALIGAGSQGSGALRFLAQSATAAVNAFAAMPGPVQAAATVLLAVGTGGTAALAVFGTVAPKIRAGREALEGMGKVGQFANVAIGFVGRAVGASIPIIAGAVAAWAIFNARHQESVRRVEDLTAAIVADSGALGENTRTTETNALEKAGALKAAQEFGISLKTLTDAALGESSAHAAVTATLDDYVSQQGAALKSGGQLYIDHQRLAKAEIILREAVAGGTKETREAVEAAKRKALADGASAKEVAGLGTVVQGATTDIRDQSLATDELGRSTGGITGTARDATGALTQYADAAGLLKAKLDALNGVNISAAEASIQFQNSLETLRKSVKDNGKGLDDLHPKARANRQAFIDAAQAAQTLSETLANQQGAEVGRQSLVKTRDSLVALGVKLGLSKTQVRLLIDEIFKIPPKAVTAVSTPGAVTARSQMNAVTLAANGIPAHRSTTITAADYASGTIQRVREQLAGIPRLVTTSIVIGSVRGAGISARQHGGAVAAHHPVVVNEVRPEVFVPATSGSVKPTAGPVNAGGAGLSAGDIRAALDGVTLVLRDPLGRTVAAQLATAGGRGRAR